ncbi:tyrosine-type recombinase/integrase [Thermodesulfobacteriota bacterium]
MLRDYINSTIHTNMVPTECLDLNELLNYSSIPVHAFRKIANGLIDSRTSFRSERVGYESVGKMNEVRRRPALVGNMRQDACLDLTARRKPSYNQQQDVSMARKERKGVFDTMRVKIRVDGKHRCKLCDSKFKQTKGGNFICPDHPEQEASAYYLQWQHNNKRVKRFGFASFIDAFTRAGAIEQSLKDGTYDPKMFNTEKGRAAKRYSFGTCYEEWKGRKEADARPSYLAKIKQYGGGYFAEFFGDRDIRLVTSDDVDAFAREFLAVKKGLKEHTRKNILGVLHKFFVDMREVKEYITVLPKFPRIKVPRRKAKWISKEDQLKILSHIPEEHQPIFEFLYRTGVRSSEARALHWSSVDWKNQRIRILHNFSEEVLVDTPKSGDERVITVDEHDIELLTKLKKRKVVGEFVFLNNQGRHYKQGYLDDQWCKAKHAAEIKSDVTLYEGTRHSWASLQINAGVSMAVIGKKMGHSTVYMTENYAHIDMDAMREMLVSW